MRAVRFDEYGGVDVLQVVDVEDPVAEPGRVVVRTVAAGINPGEIPIREGAFESQWPTTFPSGQGSDFAGWVDAVGDEDDGVAVGTPVIGWSDERSAHAELVAVPATQVVPKPDAVGWNEAAALPIAGFSALVLIDATAPASGETVLVTGAAGGVGSLTVQLAVQRGARVLALASPAHHDLLRGFGAEPVDYAGDDLEQRLRELAPDGIAAVLDTYGHGYLDLGASLGVVPQRMATIIDYDASQRTGAAMLSHAEAKSAESLSRLATLVADGGLVVPIDATYPLADVRAAYERLAERHAAGKIVLEIGEG